MGLKKLTVDLSENKSDGLSSYPRHNNSIDEGGFNTDKSYTRIFDANADIKFRQRDIPYNIPNTPNFPNGKPFMVRNLPGVESIPGSIFDIPPIGEKTIDVDGNSVTVPVVDVPPFTTRFLDNITSGFIRGGIIMAANRTLWDVIRIGKFLTTPKGVAWSILQRQLQKTNPRITEPTKKIGAPNQRKWSFGGTTLSQIAVSAFGGHVKREGNLSSILKESNGYEDWIKTISEGPGAEIEVNTKKLKKQDNRLLYLFGNEIINNTKTLETKRKEGKVKKKQSKFGKFVKKVGNALTGKGKYDTKLYDYAGGPGSTYGIGRTTIRKYPVANGTSFGHTLYDDKPWTRSTHGYIPYGHYTISRNGGLSHYETEIYLASSMFITSNAPLINQSFGDVDDDLTEPYDASHFNPLTYYDERSRVHPKTTKPNGGYSPITVSDIVDFRRIKKDAGEDIMYTNYDTKVYGGNRTYHQENRLNKGNPGKLINRGAGVNIFGATTDGYDKFDLETIDKINSLDIFKAQGNFLQTEVRDLIRFQIEAVNTDSPNTSNVMVFRALLDSLKDNYGGKWNTINYNGRGEDFFIYDKFTRTVSFSFKIAAQSRHEMMPLYRKLNYLVSNTAPDYGGGTRMRGPYMKLTIGNWLDRVPGFFKSINISWNKNYPWEISISHREGGMDRDGMGIMPHVLDVNCTYQPIHNFLPQKSINDSPFMMIHTNNRAIPNNMFRWYQPTIGDNMMKDRNDNDIVDVKKNIERAQIQGWRKIAKTSTYKQEPFKDNPDSTSDDALAKSIEETNKSKLLANPTDMDSMIDQYRLRDDIQPVKLTPKPLKLIPIDMPEIPLKLPYAKTPVEGSEGD